MPFTKCRVVIEKVSAILDGESGLVERARFHAHLAMCPNCKRYYEQFIELRAAVGEVTPQDVPEDFDKVMGFVLDALEHEEPGS